VRRLHSRGPAVFALLLAVFAQGCNQGGGPGAQAQVDPLVQKGKAVYQGNCIACHNADPRKPGSLGPEIFGSSKELIEARVMRAEYPPGYKPKRTTKAMAPLPQLKGELDALHAYLNSASTP
jgi:mono/diheme cytochrome c family protein